MPDSRIHNERELMLKIAEGDEAAFSTLFYSYYNRLGAFVITLTGDKAFAEDIVQEVFIKIWTKRQSLKSVENFNAYLYAITRNVTISSLRSIGR